MNILSISNLTLNFDSRILLSAANFEVSVGEQIALVGRNGCGKTTLLRSLAGIHKPSCGGIKVNGHDIRALSAAQIAQHILYVPNQLQYQPTFTLFEYYCACLRNRRNTTWSLAHSADEYKRIQTLLEEYGLFKFSNRFINELSSGELRKALVALALLVDSPIVLLDEPTSALDPANSQEVQGLINKLCTQANRCVIHATHNLNSDLKNASKILSIYDGQLVDEGTSCNFMQPDRLKHVFGVEYICHQVPGQRLPIAVIAEES